LENEMGLTGFQLTDLHGCGGSENVGGLPHETCRVDFGTGRDDLALSDPLLLCRGRERCRDFGAEDDVFDEDALDGHTPLVCHIAHDLGNFEGNGLALGNNGLHRPCTDDVPEGGLCSLNESLSKVADAKGCPVWVANLEVDDRVAKNRSWA
jgi:hypothetical protein